MKKTVQVVEDDFDTLYPLAELLRLKGYNVITASDAEQGLQIARERQPDLIITDIVLPGKSGLHFITTVRNDEAIKSTPIIVISGCGPMILVEAEGIGADFCLEKPINIELFWAAIDQVFGAIRESEAPKSPSADDDGRALANEIDRLVEKLRDCATKGEREAVLKRLKQRILEIQARAKSCA
jgi:twitching motility two-component system response regulator PilG